MRAHGHDAFYDIDVGNSSVDSNLSTDKFNSQEVRKLFAGVAYNLILDVTTTVCGFRSCREHFSAYHLSVGFDQSNVRCEAEPLQCGLLPDQ